MTMHPAPGPIEEVSGTDADTFAAGPAGGYRPVVIRGLAAD